MQKKELELRIPELPNDLTKLQQNISDRELREGPVKPDNEARIIWADSSYTTTEYSVVYLHGFSASCGEGDPVHRKFAASINANLYLSRLEAHGTHGKAFSKLTPQNYLDSAVRAIEIGNKIGNKCIVMGSSTGGMLALYLAGKYDGIHALFLYSPLIDFAEKSLELLKRKPVNLIANSFFPRYNLKRKKNITQEIGKYWYDKYSFRGVLSLFELVQACNSNEHFRAVTQPVFMGYYHKSISLQDPTVSVEAMLRMYEQLGTPAYRKQKKAYPDAESHVITSMLTTLVYEDVLQDSVAFFRETVAGL